MENRTEGAISNLLKINKSGKYIYDVYNYNIILIYDLENNNINVICSQHLLDVILNDILIALTKQNMMLSIHGYEF